MNNIFKKFTAFLGAAIMALGLYQGAIYADALDDAVANFTNSYLTVGGNFNIPTFQAAFGSGTDWSGVSTSGGVLRIYSLGAVAEPASLVSLAYNTPLPNTTVALALDQYTFMLNPYQLQYNSTLLAAGLPLSGKILVPYSSGQNFSIDSNFAYHCGATVTTFAEVPPPPDSPPNTPPIIVPVGSITYPFDVSETLTEIATSNAPGFLFYNLSSVAGLSSDFWLGIFQIQLQSLTFDPSSNNLIEGWSSLAYPADMVFLFGPDPGVTASPTVPEPQVYLLLGTLLGCVGLVAYRRRQKA